jgi:hypothetical protein
MENTTIEFLPSDPFLPNHTRFFDSITLQQDGKGIFEFDKLLPRSESIVHLKVSNTSEEQKMIPYVQSNEVVGYHGVHFVMAAYIVLTAALLIAPIVVFKVRGGNRITLISIIIGMGGILIATFFYLSCVPCNIY